MTDVIAGQYNATPPVLASGDTGRAQTDKRGHLITVAVSENTQYVAASATATALSGGGGGALGDRLDTLICVPLAATAIGSVTLIDGANTIGVVFFGSTITTPVALPIGLVSKNGAWKITTGASVAVLADGSFT